MRENPAGGSVTHWIGSLKAGDENAAGAIWRRVSSSLMRLARSRLGNSPRAASDEEDVALSAFHCLWRGATAGRFPQLVDRDDLWRLVATMAAQKAVDQRRHEQRAKRGGGRICRSADLRDGNALALVAAGDPTPEAAALVEEECRCMLDRLADDDLRRIAVWKLAGDSNEEIAQRLGCGLRTVERKLGVIRAVWFGKETEEKRAPV
jgi:DNA-directed RNA polymerase specialized sigma24 family protein